MSYLERLRNGELRKNLNVVVRLAVGRSRFNGQTSELVMAQCKVGHQLGDALRRLVADRTNTGGLVQVVLSENVVLVVDGGQVTSDRLGCVATCSANLTSEILSDLKQQMFSSKSNLG